MRLILTVLISNARIASVTALVFTASSCCGFSSISQTNAFAAGKPSDSVAAVCACLLSYRRTITSPLPSSASFTVSMMTFGASGDMLNRFAFAEGRSNVNSGELVISTKVPDAAASKSAKAAADDEDDEAETVEAAPAKDGKDEAEAGPSDGEKADDKKDEDDEDI